MFLNVIKCSIKRTNFCRSTDKEGQRIIIKCDKIRVGNPSSELVMIVHHLQLEGKKKELLMKLEAIKDT